MPSNVGDRVGSGQTSVVQDGGSRSGALVRRSSEIERNRQEAVQRKHQRAAERAAAGVKASPHQPQIKELSEPQKAKITLNRLRAEQKKAVAAVRHAKKAARKSATTAQNQVNPVDHHGKGHARHKRAQQVARRKEKERLQQEQVERTQSSPAKDCVFFAEGELNRCTKGAGCSRAHSTAASRNNQRRWLLKQRNAVSEMARKGLAPVPPESVRTGRIVQWDHSRGFGFIEPDAAMMPSHRKKQWIFVHFRSWVGAPATPPSEDRHLPIPVRYARVTGPRTNKWRAINVSKR